MRGRTVVDLAPVAETLARYPNVLAGWVFGSAQDGRVRPGGDVDLAVLFDREPDLDEMADLRADLQEALHFDDIDLVVLNKAHVILRYEAVCGRRLYCRDMARMAVFVSLTAREYEEAMALLQSGLAVQRAGPSCLEGAEKVPAPDKSEPRRRKGHEERARKTLKSWRALRLCGEKQGFFRSHLERRGNHE